MAFNMFTMFNKKAPKEKADPKAPKMPGNARGKSSGEVLAEGMVNVRDIIAPSAIEIDFNDLKVGNMFYRVLFVSGYPRFVGANWLSPIINFDHSLDLSMFYYPVKSKVILDDLRRKITELEATVMSTREKGRISDPVVSAALDDANALQEQLVKGVEKYFQFSFYIKIPAATMEELENITSKIESTLGSLLLISKTASLQMEDAFQSTVPSGMDKLLITRNMDTTSLATTFPFTSSDLTMEEGIMYGINRNNGSLIIFDRFSMENANAVVFAKSGAGKSFFVKLEALRLMVFGAEVMIIDPEEEYRPLCDAVGGDYISFSANATHKINPFDLSGIATEGENELGQKLISLVTLLKLMMGSLTPTEEAILDRALIETYRIKGITTDPETQMSKEPPVMEDLYKVLMGGDEPESKGMADRLERFIRGSMAGIFDSQSNIDLNSKMTVFSTKNLEEALRPIAFYMILDFVWTRIRRDLRKRILIVEEAWYLMQNEDSARFIYGIAKRARKYYLGLTTISQDVDDFLNSEYGKAIVTNSSIQILLKQHPAAIDKVADTFYLSEGEKRLLLAADKGEGLFFAGAQHVAMKAVASDAEYKLITTNPEELLKLREEGIIKPKTPTKPSYRQFRPSDPNEYTTMDATGKPREEFMSPMQKVVADVQAAQVIEDARVMPKPPAYVPPVVPAAPTTPVAQATPVTQSTPATSVPTQPASQPVRSSAPVSTPAMAQPPLNVQAAADKIADEVVRMVETKPSPRVDVPEMQRSSTQTQTKAQTQEEVDDRMPSTKDILESVAKYSQVSPARLATPSPQQAAPTPAPAAMPSTAPSATPISRFPPIPNVSQQPASSSAQPTANPNPPTLPKILQNAMAQSQQPSVAQMTRQAFVNPQAALAQPATFAAQNPTARQAIRTSFAAPQPNQAQPQQPTQPRPLDAQPFKEKTITLDNTNSTDGDLS